jgi:CRISPR-associated protein Cmr3
VRLGGEGRTATLERGPSLPALPPPLAGARRLALCFATPALSTAGSLPPGFDAQTHQGTLGGVPTKLVAAVVQAPLQVGGWDVAQRRPKPLRNAIPPGSVYLVEPLAGTTQDLAHRVSGSSLSADGTDHLTQQGFGLALGGASL